eukprot:1832002-Pleurochrysis_carterae.AAC.3
MPRACLLCAVLLASSATIVHAPKGLPTPTVPRTILQAQQTLKSMLRRSLDRVQLLLALLPLLPLLQSLVLTCITVACTVPVRLKVQMRMMPKRAGA